MKQLPTIEECKNAVAQKYRFEEWAKFDPNNEWQPECDDVVFEFAKRLLDYVAENANSMITACEVEESIIKIKDQLV